jgi:S1-C subfamily serine protease
MKMKWIFPICAFVLIIRFAAAQEPATNTKTNKFDLLRKSAEQGSKTAQCKLAVCYEYGDGIPSDNREAIKWYRKSADQGYAPAQLFLGFRCYNDKNYVEAVVWYRKAAEQGMPDAESKLGLSYYSGQGVPQDYALAVKWFRKAAEHGNPTGQAMLGVCFADGYGVPINDVESYRWLSLAAAGEWDNREDNVQEMVSEKLQKGQARMSRAEIVEAQKLAAAFTPKVNKPSSIPDDSALHKNPTASGTGFFITEDGYLISNNHVVEGASKVRLVTAAGLISAKVVRVDAANDLALLKAEGRFTPLPLTASRSVKLGGTVATVGFPNIGLQGFAPKLAKGEIASLSGAGDDARYFQISVPVQPGNSGGALVDERGNVVGVVSAKLNAKAALESSGSLPENVNYAVKSSFLLSFLESVPDVANKLKEPNTKDAKFEDVVKSAQDAAVLVLVY